MNEFDVRGIPEAAQLTIGRGVHEVGDGCRLAIVGVVPYDFGSGHVTAARVALREKDGAEHLGWVGVGSVMTAGGAQWTVTGIAAEAEGGPSIQLTPNV